MGKPTSNDLRERMVRGVESGQARRAVAARLGPPPPRSPSLGREAIAEKAGQAGRCRNR